MAGALVYIVAHGLFSAALFLLLGYIEEREETRSLLRLGGLGWKNPRLAGALCIAALAALGVTGFCRIRRRAHDSYRRLQAGYVWPAIVALVAIVIASAYMIRLYQDLMNGPEVEDVPVRARSQLARRPRRLAAACRARYCGRLSGRRCYGYDAAVYATPTGRRFFP